MNDRLAFPQLDILRGCSVQEARDLGIDRGKCWDMAWECMRLMGKLDDDECLDLLGKVRDMYEDNNEANGLRAALQDAEYEITHLPYTPEPEPFDPEDQYAA